MTSRVANRTELDSFIASIFAGAPKAEMAKRLKAAGVAFGMLNDVDGLIDHPQLRTVEYETPQGLVRAIAPAAQTDVEELGFGSVPAVGAHTEALRREFAPRSHVSNRGG
jgi:crotonobetainyl-CoA:carnitine CoA-transferase CaiB-like acyl-CoA transferase